MRASRGGQAQTGAPFYRTASGWFPAAARPRALHSRPPLAARNAPAPSEPRLRQTRCAPATAAASHTDNPDRTPSQNRARAAPGDAHPASRANARLVPVFQPEPLLSCGLARLYRCARAGPVVAPRYPSLRSTASPSISISMFSLTITPPGMGALKLTPKSVRLILVVAENPARVPP